MFVRPTEYSSDIRLERLSYQSKSILSTSSITIIFKGENKTCPISEIAIIIISLKFIGSFEASVFSQFY